MVLKITIQRSNHSQKRDQYSISKNDKSYILGEKRVFLIDNMGQKYHLDRTFLLNLTRSIDWCTIRNPAPRSYTFKSLQLPVACMATLEINNAKNKKF